jgi:hypothetical protein
MELSASPTEPSGTRALSHAQPRTQSRDEREHTRNPGNNPDPPHIAHHGPQSPDVSRIDRSQVFIRCLAGDLMLGGSQDGVGRRCNVLVRRAVRVRAVV